MKNSNNNLCPRGSVGAIVRQDGKILMLYRKVFPLGLAAPTGHIEKDKGETPEQALRRELREETGIEAETFRPVLQKTYSNPCSKGFTHHEWAVYEVDSWSGTPTLMEKEKHEFLKFLTPSQIKEFCDRGDADPAWSDFILPDLGII